MKNENNTGLDMEAELFIGPRAKLEYLVPPKTEEQYLQDLRQGSELDKKGAMRALIHLYRGKAFNSDGKYTENIAGSVITIFKQLAFSPELSGWAAWELGGEGGECEKFGDYQGAAWFYAAALEFETKDPDLSFFRLNNLGFCLNFLKKFKEAEPYLRAAAEMDPKRYNAWKNLGVTTEHLGNAQEAAQCYMRAINASHAEKRCVKHLLRLLTRHPELRAIPQVAGYLDSLAKAGIIDKTGQA